MTVATTSLLAGPFIGTGADAALAFAFKCFATGDLEVVRDGTVLAYGADYTVNLNLDQDNSPGGAVNILAAANTLAAEIYVRLDMAESQPTALPAQGNWSPKVVEKALDRLALIAKQISLKLNRALIAPIGETLGALPIAALRAGKFLAFDAGGLLTASAGTGADAGLRTDLAAAGGSALVGFAGGIPNAGLPYRYVKAGSLLTPGSGGELFSTTEGACGDIYYWGREYSGVKAPGASGVTNYGYGPALWQYDARTDTADAGSDFVRVGSFRTVFGGTTAKGGRIGLLGEVYQQLGATNVLNTNRNYVGLVGQATTDSGDGGTDTGAGAKGAYFGLNGVAMVRAGATDLLEATGAEINTYVKAGASIRYLCGSTIVGVNEVRGAEVDAALEIGGGSAGSGFGPHIGWKFGILFSDIHGADPTYSGSTLIGSYWGGTAGLRPITHGVDLSGFAISGAIIQGARAALSESGLLLGADGGTSGNSTITAGNGATNASLVLKGKGTGTTNLADSAGVNRVVVDSVRGVVLAPVASSAPTQNGELSVEATNNTTLTFRFKGSDGVVRSGTVTLA